MAELADALDLGSSAQKACRFKSCSRHQLEVPQLRSGFRHAAQTPRNRLKFKSCSLHQPEGRDVIPNPSFPG
jgi:hypothetical protein